MRRPYAELVRAFRAGRAAGGRGAVRAGAEAEDGVRQAPFGAYRPPGRFRDGGAFLPWLPRIVLDETRNTVRSAVRQRAAAGRREPLIPESAGPEGPAVAAGRPSRWSSARSEPAGAGTGALTLRPKSPCRASPGRPARESRHGCGWTGRPPGPAREPAAGVARPGGRGPRPGARRRGG